MTIAIAVALRIIPPVARNLVRIKLTWIGFDSLIVDVECGNYELNCIIDRFTFDAGVILFDDAGTIFVVLQRVGDQHDPENVSVDDLSIDGEKEENIPIHSMRSKHIIGKRRAWTMHVSVLWD